MPIKTSLPFAARSSAPSTLPRLHRRTTLTLALAAAFGGGATQVQAQNQIVPNDKTATQLQVNGSVTNITTGTIKGATGFNSFSRFEVERSNTVNLILPPATRNLVNLVTDRAIEINGVVNSLKDGRIGGNVVFADPNGMLVGASGVLNVGSLSVLTPSRGFVDGVIGVDGSIDDLAVSKLLRGNAERSSGGLIRIDGQVNALEKIRINAARIDIGGTLAAGADVVHRAAFKDAVNAGGLQGSTGLINRGGVIELVADDSVQISGSIDAAQRKGSGSGGTVTVMADTIKLSGGASLDVSGTRGGGQIQLGVMTGPGGASLHAGSMLVNRGARLMADALDSGNGGQIVVWGDRGNSFAGEAFARGGRDGGNGGMVEVSAISGLRITGEVDTSAAQGTAGTLLIDPDNIDIVEGTTADSTDNVITVGWLQSRGNQNTTLAATEKLTVGNAAGADVDLSSTLTSATLSLSAAEVLINGGARISTGGGNIELKGSKITLNALSAIDTGAGASGSVVGNITATALSEDVGVAMGDRSADASILVNGSLNGNVITLSATAKAETTSPDVYVDSSLVDARNRVTGLLGFKWIEGISSGGASVTIGSTADLTATDKIDIKADSSQISRLDLRLGDSANPLFNTVAVHGKVEGGATALVESGASLKAGDLSVKATNNSKLEVLAKVFSFNDSLGVSLAYGESSVDTSATVRAGAKLDITGAIDVIGRSEASYSVEASSSAWGVGKAGIAAAIGDLSSSSVAELNVDTSSAGNVRVQAENLVSKNFTKASTETGSGFITQKLGATTMQLLSGGTDALTSGSSIVANKLAQAYKKSNQASGGSTDTSTTTLKIGSALSLVDADFSAHASIGPSATVASTQGDVVVYANVEDHKVHNIAQSAVSSATTKSDGTSADPAAQYSASAGVALAFLNHDAQAVIGRDADISAKAIVVDSRVSLPLDITWAQWEGFSSITNKISTKLGVPEEVLTSYANASAEATGVALAGSVNWFDVANTSRAWVEQGATLQATRASGAHTIALDGSDPVNLTVAQPISIAAHNQIETIGVAGNLSAKMITGTGGGADTTAVGGAFVGVQYQNNTLAGVDDRAELSADNGGISISAESDDKAYVIAPSTGSGSSISGNGAGAYTHIDNTTQAVLSNRAKVTAESLDLSAQESLEIWTVAGALNQSSGTAVGASVALNDLKTETVALIGDVSAQRADTSQVNSADLGHLHLGDGDLRLTAVTQGQAAALSVAAALAKSEPPPPKSPDDPAKTSETEAQTATQDSSDSSASKLAEVDAKVSEITQPLREAQGLAKKAAPPPDQPKLNLSAAGSASVNLSAITTTATIDAATDTTTGTLALTASNNTNLIAVSGGAALTLAKAPSVQRSGALAGAVAINIETGNTRAGVSDSVFTDIESVAINAWTSGQHVAVGLGLAVNSQTKDSSTLVGSVSLAQVKNTTEAFADGSDFSALANSPGDLTVLAYDGSLLGIGGGALAIGGSTAVGVAVSYGDVSNTVSARLDDSRTHGDFDDLTVAALSPTTIVATAVEVAGTTGKTAVGASAAVTQIRNHTTASIGDSDVGADKIRVLATDSPDKENLSALLTQADAALGVSPSDGGQNVVDFKDTGLAGEAPADGASIVSIAGALQVGQSAFGAALSYNDVQNETRAQLSGTAHGNLEVRAADWSNVIGVALGVAVGSSGNAAGVGSATVNLVHNTTSAHIGKDDGLAATEVTAVNSSATASDPVSVVATSGSSVWSVAGSAAKSKSGNSGGAAIAYNKSDSDTQARIVNADITATQGGVKVDAQHAARLNAIAAAVSQSDEMNAVGGSYAHNVINDSLAATVSGSSLSAARLKVLAGDADSSNASIQSLSGGAALASQGGAGGGGISVNEVGLRQSALIEDSSLTIDESVDIEATSNTRIGAVAIGASISKLAGIGLSSTANTITNVTSADLTATSLKGSVSAADPTQTHRVNLTIKAEDGSVIDSLAGTLGVGETGGIGASISVNRINNDVSATLAGGQHVNGIADTVRVENLWVEALSKEATRSIAVGLGGGLKTGLAGGGSVAVNTSGSQTRAAIDRNADVDAANNVGVVAGNTNTVAALAGGVGLSRSGLGVGMSTSVNSLSDQTSATVGGRDVAGQGATSVVARGMDAGKQMEVNTGALEGSVSLIDGLTESAKFKAAALKEQTREMNGLAVNATSFQALSSAAVSVGGGKSGAAALTTATNHIGGSTTAEITEARINQGASPAPLIGRDVDVKASNHTAMSSLVGAVALSGGASGGIAIDTMTLSGATTARVIDSDVAAAGQLRIEAQSSATLAALAAGVAIGSDAGGAGTGLVAELSGKTVAALVGHKTEVDSLDIGATSQQSVKLLGGGIGGGGNVGLGAAFAVIDSGQTTQAYIGDAYAPTDASGAALAYVPKSTQVISSGDVSVEATTEMDNAIYIASAGVSGQVGIGLTAGVMLSSNKTEAQVAFVGAAGSLGLKAGGKLSVKASEIDVSLQGAGALGVGVGAAGIGATVAVTVAKAQVLAQIRDSQVESAGLLLSAVNDQKLSHTAISVGAGTYAGVGGSFSLVQLGSGDAGATGLTGGGGALSNVNALTSRANTGDTGGTLSEAELAALGDNTRLNLDTEGVLSAGNRNSAVAHIASSTVTTKAAGDLEVQAWVKTDITNTAGGVGVGGVGAGGSVAVSNVYNNVEASSDRQSTLDTAGDLKLGASSANGSGSDAIRSTAFAGGAGAVGLGAAVGVATLDNQVLAEVGSQATAAGDASISATDSTSIDLQAVSVAAGFVAGGLTYVEAKKAGSVQATFRPAPAAVAAAMGGMTVRGPIGLDINASSSGRVEAEAVVGNGGIGLAAGGNHAAAIDSVNVTADIGDGALVSARATSVTASRTPQVFASTYSVGVAGGVQVGVSESEAKITGKTSASVGDDVEFSLVLDANGHALPTPLTVKAQTLKPDNAESAEARAFASGGGALAGVNGALAFATNSSDTEALVGDDVTLPYGDVKLSARADSSQRAQASGVSVGGVLGVGADYAEASSNRSTRAALGSAAKAAVFTGALTIEANGTDDNQAYSEAGAGGILAGAAAVAATSTKGSTTAEIAAAAAAVPSLWTGDVTLSARHNSHFFSQSDAVQGSLAGGSGARSTGTVDYTVAAEVGRFAALDASDIRIEALNTVVESALGDNAKGASGGAVAGAGMSSVNNINTHTRATVGDDASLVVSGDPLSPAHGDLRVVVGNTVVASDSASVNAGGAFAGLTAESITRVNSDNSISVGERSRLSSVGHLDLGTYSTADVKNDSYAHGYGLAGGAGGNSTSDINVDQKVSIKADAKLDAWGDLSLATGRADGGALGNVLQAKATNQVYFDGAFNGTDPHGEANIHNNGAITVAAGATLDSVRNIALASVAGVSSVEASGSGHYTILGIPVSNSDQSTSNDGQQSLSFDGTARAGIRHDVWLDVARDGTVTQHNLDGAVVRNDHYTPVKNLADQVARLTTLKASLSGTAQADAQAQIDTLNALVLTLNGRGLNASSEISAIGVDSTMAAGGNIDIEADQIEGSGSLTAWGGPKIRLHNASSNFLVLDQLFIPNQLGGNIRLRGAGQAPLSLSRTEVDKDGAASIDIRNTFDTSVPGQTNARAPAIFLTNSIESAGGALSIFNQSGDLGQFGAVTVESLDLQVPNGAYIVNSPDVGFFLKGDPQAAFGAAGVVKDTRTKNVFSSTTEWNTKNLPYVYLPGGSDPLSSLSSLQSSSGGGFGNLGSSDEAITILANYFAQQLPGYTDADSASSWALGNFLAGGPPRYREFVGFNLQPFSPTDGTGYMFFYPGNAFGVGTGAAYNAANGGDIPIYGDRYYLPQIGVKKLVNTVASLPQPAATTVTRVGTNAIINAKYIDINGSIKAGLEQDFSAMISEVVGTGSNQIPLGKNFIDCINDVVCRPSVSSFLTANGLYKYPSSGIAVVSAGDTAVDVYYDPNIRQLVLQNISGGGAGSVSLRGAIINTNNSTSHGSSIEVATGYAKVNVVNNTGANLQTGDINTGNGNVGVIKITDTLKTDGQGNALTTWYVNRLGQGTSQYQSTTATDYADLAPSASSGSYAPTEGARYVWRYDADLRRTLTDDSSWSDASTSAWVWTTSGSNSTDSLGGVWSITKGVEIDASLVGSDYKQSFSGSASGIQAEIDYSYYGPWTWTWDVMTRAHITSTVSVKADHGIKIGFDGGRQAGEVSIASAQSSILLGGKIQNINGLTSLSATGATATVKANANGAIDTQSLAIHAGSGIGAVNDLLDVTLTNAAGAAPGLNTVTAVTSRGDIGLAFSGADAILSNVRTDASGDVWLHANGSMRGDAAQAVAVTGRNITLLSDNGSIGSVADPLAIQTLAGTNAQTGAVTGGVLNADALGHIGIRQDTGDLYLGHVSAVGDVKLVASGHLLDGRKLELTDKTAELAAVWDKMDLHASSNDRSAVEAFENTLKGYYASYWSLTSHGAVVNGSLILDAAGIKALQAQADQSLQAHNGQSFVAGLSLAPPSVSATEQQVRDFAQTRYLALSAAIVAARSSSTDGQAYQTLLQSGTLSDGSIVLSANGLKTQRLAAEVDLGRPLSDSEVTAYAQKQHDGLLAKLQLESASNDYFSAAVVDKYKLFNRGSINATGGYLLSVEGVEAMQAEVDLHLGRKALETEVQDYAAQQYSVLTAAINAVSFAPSADQVSALTRGQYWSGDALLYQINASALQPASGASTAVSDVNIKGRNVALISSAAGIGQLGDAVGFDLGGGGLNGASLSDAQKAALASANSAGDLINQVYTRDGLVNSNCSAALLDCQLVSFDIKQTRPLFLNVSQGLSGSADSNAYIQAQGSLPLAGFSAGGNLTLVSENGMSNTAASGVVAVKAGTLNLQNGSGSIGSAAAPLTLAVGGQLQSVRSGNGQSGDVYLDVASGNLSFLNLFAANLLSIKTSDSAAGMGNVFSSNAIAGQSVVSVAAQSLVLDTTGSVFQDANGTRSALAVRLGSDEAPGELRGKVGGDLDLWNDTAFTVGALEVVGNAALSTDRADITVDALSAGKVSLSSATGKILGQQRLTGSAEHIYSAGTVTLNGGVHIALTPGQGGGIGDDSEHRLLVSAQHLDATTAAGDIFIGLANNNFTDRTASIVGRPGTEIDLSSSVDFIAQQVASATGGNSATDSDTGNDIRLSSTGTARMRLADVRSGRDLLINSVDGVFVIEPNASLVATRDIVLTMTGNGTMTDATANGTSTSSISAGRNIGMNAAAIRLNALSATGGIDLAARTGDIDYAQLTALNGSVTATAKGSITGQAGGHITAGGDVRLAANAVALADVQAGQDLVIRLEGGQLSTLAGSQVEAQRDLRVTLTGSAVLDDASATGLTAGRDAFLDASALRLQDFSAGRDLNLSARAGDIHYTNLRALGGALNASASGDLLGTSGGSIGAQGDIALTAAGMVLPQVEAGGDLDITASTGDVRYTNLKAGVDLRASAQGALTGDASSLLQAGGQATVVADSASFDRITVGGTADLTSLAGSLTGSGLLQADTLIVNARTSAQLNAVKTSGTALDQITAAQVSIGSLDTAQSVLIQSAGDITLGSVQIGNASSAADLSAQAVGSLSATSGDVWRDLEASGTTIDLGALRVHGNSMTKTSGDFHAGSLTVDGDWVATTGGSFTVGALDVGGKLDVNALVELDIGVGRVGSDAVLTSAGMKLGELSAGRDLVLTATSGDLNYNRLSAGRDVDAQVSGQLVGSAAGVMRARRDVTIAADSVKFGTVKAGRAMSVTAEKALSGNVLAAGGALDLVVGRTVTIRDASAGGVLNVSAKGSMDLGRLTGEALALTTPGTISIDEVRVGTSLALAANGISAGVTALSPNPIQIDATGVGAGLAPTIVLKVDAPLGIEFKRLYANNASIESTASYNAIADARIGALLKYRTPTGAFEVSGTVPAFVPDLLAQFYQPSFQSFFQTLDGRNFFTNAYVLQLNRYAFANSASYNQNHRDSNVPGFNASALRDASLLHPFDWSWQLEGLVTPTREEKPVQLEDGFVNAVNVGQL